MNSMVAITFFALVAAVSAGVVAPAAPLVHSAYTAPLVARAAIAAPYGFAAAPYHAGYLNHAGLAYGHHGAIAAPVAYNGHLAHGALTHGAIAAPLAYNGHLTHGGLAHGGYAYPAYAGAYGYPYAAGYNGALAAPFGYQALIKK